MPTADVSVNSLAIHTPGSMQAALVDRMRQLAHDHIGACLAQNAAASPRSASSESRSHAHIEAQHIVQQHLMLRRKKADI